VTESRSSQARNCGVRSRSKFRTYVKQRHLANQNFHSNRIAGLEATYAVHLRLTGKLVGDFLLVIIELFFARCILFVTIHAFDRQTDRQTDKRTDVDSKVRSNEVKSAQKQRRERKKKRKKRTRRRMKMSKTKT